MGEKVAVVTGAAKGLGRAIALSLATEGWTIVIHYLTSHIAAQKLLGQVNKKSSGFLVSADLTDEVSVAKMFGKILRRFGKVDLLVNNVGNFIYKDFSEMETSEFRDSIESNLYATLYCSRAVLPTMRRARSGQIINIGAVGAERLTIRMKSSPYFLAKTGVYMLTKTMAYEEAKNRIRINMISPGSMATDIFSAGDFPMGRPTKYADVINVLKFLISDEAHYINGANIEVAGAFIPGF